eukprot:UN12300
MLKVNRTFCRFQLLQLVTPSIRSTQSQSSNKISGWKNKLSTINKLLDSEETANLYNEWANEYDESVQEWGYVIPSVMANLVKTHLANEARSKQLKLFDLGCGTGLIGQELIAKHCDIDVKIFGCDLSDQQFDITKERGYYGLQQWNLNNYPFPYKDHEFDIITCGGTLTYSQEKTA